MTSTGESRDSKFCIFFVLLTQLSIAFFALNLSALNTPAPADRYGEAASDEVVTLILTLAQSGLVWGSVLGAFLVGGALKLSRKRSVLLVHILNVLSTILMGLVARFGKSYEALIVGRFISGVSRALGFSLMTVVAAETTSRSKLGVFQSPFGITSSVTLAFGAALGHYKVLGTPELWSWIVCFPALSSIIYFCFYPQLPETPVSLLRQGNYNEAMLTLKRLRTSSSDVNEELEILIQEVKEEPAKRAISISTILKTPHLRLQFFTALVIMNSHGLTGSQGIILYSDYLLQKAGVNPEYVTLVTIGIYLQAIVAFLIYLPIQGRFGTKTIFLIGVVISTISLVIFTTSNALHQEIPWLSYLALAALCTTIFGNRLGPQLTLNGFMSEVTTAASRPTVAFYCGVTYWINGAVTALVLPYSVAAWNAYAYIPFIVCSLAIVIFIVFVAPETHNRTTAEIQQSFRKKSEQSLIQIFTLHRHIIRRTSTVPQVSSGCHNSDFTDE